VTNPLVAAPKSSTTAVSGIPLLESAADVKTAIESGDWASVAMGVAGTALDALTTVLDPFGSAIAAGVGWLLEHVGPLREALDAIAGDADQVRAHAETWTNVAKELGAVGGDLASLVDGDTTGWTGSSADSYRSLGANTANLIVAAQQAASGAASGVQMGGEVVAAVRMFIRDTIAEVVGHLVSWALQVVFTLGFGLTWVVPQVVGEVAKVANKLAGILTKLVKALGRLTPLLRRTGDIFADTAKQLRKLDVDRAGPAPARHTPDIGGSRGLDGPNSSTNASSADNGPGHKSTPDPKPEPKPEPKQDHGDGPGPNGPTSRGLGPDSKTAPSGSPNKPSPPRDSAVPKDDLTCKSDPVDVASGKVVFDQVDLELPSPLTFERLHLSSYRAGLWFGTSWTSTVDQRLEVDADDVCYFSPDGMVLVYPRVAVGVPALPVEGPRLPLTLSEDGTYTLTGPVRNRELRFGPLPGRGRAVLPVRMIADRGGARVDIDYDEFGAPVLMRHSDGYLVALRTESGRVTEVRMLDPGKRFDVLVTRFAYDEKGRLTGVVDSSGIPQVFDYDADGRMTGWQDRSGHWYRYIYDDQGRCVRTVGDKGFHDGTFTYGQGVTVHTDSLGNRTEFHLNEAKQVIGEVDPYGNVTASEWDRYDRLLSRTDPLGRTTAYEYAADGELAAIVRPDGSRLEMSRGEGGELAVTVASWQRVYPAGAAPDLVAGRVATTFDPGRQWGATAPGPVAGEAVERDLFGRARVVADELGGHTSLRWTVEGRQVSRIGPSGRHEKWRYDAEGNVVEHTRGPRRLRHEYGPFDLKIASTDATGARTTFEYDTELRLRRMTNPAGLSWHFTYDAAGRLIEERDFDGRVLRFGYDAAGQLVRSVNGLGEVTKYTYDPLGNLIERRTGNRVTTYAYDPAGTLVRATDADTVLEIERDEHGRVVRESVDGRAVTYTYDARTVRRHTPSEVDSTWTFDADGNPETLAVAGHVMTFQHDDAGREIERTTGDGAVLTQDYDTEHQLAGQTVVADGRVVQQRGYRYEVDGQLAGVDDAISGAVRFRLDPAGRVTGVVGPAGAENYRYDPAGNIVRADVAGPELGPRRYTGNSLSVAGVVRYAYDRQGRLTARHEADRTWTYSWDVLDRLVGARTPDGAVWRYRYDPLGRRIAKQRLVSGGRVAEEVEFVWSGQLLVEQVHRDEHGQRRVLTWDHHPGSVRPVAQTEQLGARFFAFVTDQVGTPVDMVDTHGVVAWHGTNSLWGRAKPGRANGVSTPLRFPGQYADEETGLLYNVFRYYDPGTGRYLSQDPLGLSPAPNPVAYVPNPLLDSDPLGLGSALSCLRGDDDPPSRPASTHDAGNIQSNNPPRTPTPDHTEAAAAPPKTPPPPVPEGPYRAEIADYKERLGINHPVRLLAVPDDPKITLGTPVSKLDDKYKNNLTPEDNDKLVGEFLGIDRKDLDDPAQEEFRNYPAHGALDMNGGGAYNTDQNAIAIQEKKGNVTLFHEMGHTQQNEHGFNGRNTSNRILEYHNVLRNENSIVEDGGTLRDNYMWKELMPRDRHINKTWADLEEAVGSSGMPQDRAALQQIEETLNNDPRYANNKDEIKQNLIDEHFHAAKKK
jgi:RHS repeat-associated protein